MIRGNFYKAYISLVIVFLGIHFYISQIVSDICYINENAVFGSFTGISNEAVLLAGAVSIPVLFSIFKIFRLDRPHAKVGMLLTLTAIAGFSNLLDRVLHEGVCDYLSIRLGSSPLHFNLNDVVLTANVLLVAYSLHKENVNKN